MKTIKIVYTSNASVSFDCQDVLIKDGMLLVIQKEKTLGFNISIVHHFIFTQTEKEGNKE